MRRLSVPGAEVRVSQLGLGCARMHGGSELRHSAALIEAALAAGITHFDTAPAYGSEGLLGEVLSGSSVTIATKVGLPRSQPPKSLGRRVLAPLYRRTARSALTHMPRLKARLLKATASAGRETVVAPRRRISRAEVLAELDVSLKNLRRSAIDLYLLHEPDGIEVNDELSEVFAELQAQGAIKAYGLAFGGKVHAHRRFGTVLQGGAPFETTENEAEVLYIAHGVIRSAPDQRARAPALLAQTLATQPTRAVLFSASSPHQIASIARACRVT